jgi:uncharacterized SAM-binding protein YcdF (DUF218 family)
MGNRNVNVSLHSCLAEAALPLIRSHVPARLRDWMGLIWLLLLDTPSLPRSSLSPLFRVHCRRESATHHHHFPPSSPDSQLPHLPL